MGAVAAQAVRKGTGCGGFDSRRIHGTIRDTGSRLASEDRSQVVVHQPKISEKVCQGMTHLF